MKFKFDDKQPYQQDAVAAVVDLFEGQPKDADKLHTVLQGRLVVEDEVQESLDGSDLVQTAFDVELTQEVGAIGNNLVLDDETILENLQRIQDRGGLEISEDLASHDGLDFDVEMETGTGKTYVYLRTAFELAEKYDFTKFIILVPSVAIREGVATSIRLMKDHFRELYPSLPFDTFVYSGKSAEEVQPFATSTNLQIMIMTISSIRGKAEQRIVKQARNQLGGFRPLDYLRATHPVVIMDEPQNMKSDDSKAAISDLDPMCTLRYSATPGKRPHVVYKLDPVDAHDKGLVKQIVVAETTQQGTDATPYIKLLDVRRDPKWQARLDLVCRKADGSLARKAQWVNDGADLERVTDNPAYANNWRVNGVSLDPAEIELTNHGILSVGEEIGGSSNEVFKEMIRETIREHMRKEAQLRRDGVKVLSLFFIDKVANFLGDGSTNFDANGEFVKWFDELYREERARRPEYVDILPEDPLDVRKAYFAQMKRGKGKTAVETYVDSSGSTKKDDDAYELIMRNKEELLSSENPVRFIFSHSALREGWDNPNVFQICTLRDMSGETERRQTIGRGLRLPVNQEGDRLSDRSIAQLTVVANESYQEFARSLQDEYKKAGVSIGFVRKGEFAKIPVEYDSGELLGTKRSTQLWTTLQGLGFLDDRGRVTEKFTPNQLGFTLGLPIEYDGMETPIMDVLNKCKLDVIIKPKRARVTRKLNKELYWTPEFEDFWEAISRKTTYRVTVDRDELIREAVKRIREADPIQPLRIQVTRAGVKIRRGGAIGEELGTRSADLVGTYDLPDIIHELQEATSLTRKTIIDILVDSDRLDEFITNPNDYIALVKSAIKGAMDQILTEGVQYEKIRGSVYELRELRKDGQEEKDNFLDNLYEVQNKQKSDFDYVIYDSEVEKQFAQKLDTREDIKLFLKLPAKFKIDTPVGPYNPDWAIIKVEDGEERLYMIRETKSTANYDRLRGSEKHKILAAKEHFKAIGVDYGKSSPENWGLKSE